MDRIRASISRFSPKTKASTTANSANDDSRENASMDSSSQKSEKSRKPADQSPPKEETSQPTTTQAEPDDYIEGLKLWIVLLSVTLVAFIMLLDTSIVATAIPRITDQFHSLDDVGWYGAAYLISSAALQPLTGKIYSIFNSKYCFLSFIGIFELGSLLTAVATGSKMFIVGRAVAGMGASGIINGALTILAACLPMHKRPAFLGAMISFAQMGLVCGPLIGGALTERASWRWCFYINLPAGGACALLLLLVRIPNRIPKRPKGGTITTILKKLDLVGFGLFAPAAIQVLLALEWGGTRYPWHSSKIIGLFCGSGATLFVFLLWQWHMDDGAMIPFSAIRQKIVWSSCLVMLFFFGSVMASVYYLPIWFQSVKGVSPITSGVWLLPTMLPQMLFAVISGVSVGKLGYYLPWVLASGCLMSIGTGLITTFTPTTPTGKWVGYQILAGIGRGCGIQMPIIAIQNTLPPQMISIGMALVVFFQTFGGAIFLATAETDFVSSLSKALPQYAPGVSAQAVIVAGATRIRHEVSPDQLPGVIKAYNQACDHAFYLAAGGSVAVFFLAWGMGWKSIKKAKPAPAASASSEKAEEESKKEEV